MTKCPCKDCICVPVCRHKTITILFKECATLIDYENINIERLEDDGGRIYINVIERTLKPSRWTYSSEENTETYGSGLVHFIQSRKRSP